MKSTNNRERELKFESATSYKDAVNYVQAQFPGCTPIIGMGVDLFWECEQADFIRLRSNPNMSSGELTVKYTDKKSIKDRLEINLDVDHATARALMTAAHGPYKLMIKKVYHVFLLPGDIAISVYEVGREDVYIEVEAPTLATVYKTLPSISDCLGDVINKSLYQIYKEKSHGRP